MTLLRSLIIGGIAVMIARPLCALLIADRLSHRRIAWALLLAPYFTPILLTGYAYANFSLSLIHQPGINTLFYSALLGLKFTPLAVVIFHFAPAPISPEAIHCRRLSARNRSKIEEWKFLLQAGGARAPIAAFAVVFLCAFAEFEMASLMGVKSWTVTLFDSNAGGGALSESLRRMLGPLLCETAAIVTVLLVLGKQRLRSAQRSVSRTKTSWLPWVYLTMAFIFVLMIFHRRVLGFHHRARPRIPLPYRSRHRDLASHHFDHPGLANPSSHRSIEQRLHDRIYRTCHQLPGREQFGSRRHLVPPRLARF